MFSKSILSTSKTLLSKKCPPKQRIFSLPALTTLFVITLLSACASISTSNDLTKLYVFDCGNIEVRDLSIFTPGINEGQVKQMTDSCYLIQHEKGMLLWDAGLSDSLGPKGIDAWEGKFHLSVSNPLAKQLEEININPTDINFIGISHFHGDHTGNANLFTQAALIIQQEEYDVAFGDDPAAAGFNPDSYKDLDKSKMKIVTGDFDVFGDETVIIKRAVGHTPGHQVLFVDLAESGPILLSGDLYHFTDNRTNKRVPSFNFNKVQTLESMAQIEAFVEQKKAQLWIQHDLEQNKAIKHAPAYYQ
jgi:N-acyl homoserine lactone hydrolase